MKKQRRHEDPVKDGDDKYLARRQVRRQPSSYTIPRTVYAKCACGGKMKPKGSYDVCGRTSSKCSRCGRRVIAKHYKGAAGLWDGR